MFLFPKDQRLSSLASGMVSFRGSEEAAADDSFAGSDAEDWSYSVEDPDLLLPRGSRDVRPRVKRELICILMKAVEELSLEWSAQEEPGHSRLDEWFLPRCRQRAPHQRPA